MKWSALLPLIALSVATAVPVSAETSVKPGINEKFLDPELKVDEWLQRFEVESREVFHAREAVLQACGVKPGMRVADIGAGTGLYTRLFANSVGEKGWVYAVDINPAFLQHIQARAKQEGQNHVSSVLCPEDSVTLPPGSIDLAFVCDTYHHFEYPKSTLASILSALKPGGQFIVVDFIRIEGESSDWTLNHVRAGEEVFRQEIVDAGFKFVGRETVAGLEENYCLRFEKPAE